MVGPTVDSVVAGSVVAESAAQKAAGSDILVFA